MVKKGTIHSTSSEFSHLIETLEHVKGDVYAEIFRRAMLGTKEAVIQKGEQATMATGEPAWITRYDNRLLLRLAAKLDPEWSERRTVDHNIHHASTVMLQPSDLVALSADQRDQLQDILITIKTNRDDVKALTHQPAEVIDADFEEVGDMTDAEIAEAIPY